MTHEIGIIFALAAVICFIFKELKQPMIPAYVLIGVVAGPLVLGWIDHADVIRDISEIAIVVMLFIVGIEMDLSRLKKVGLVAILGGALQVGSTFAVGFFAGRMFGLTGMACAYLGFALAFSSTMLVVKVLGDKYEMNTIHGRVAIGILVMQDILAIFALAVLATFDNFSLGTLLTTSTVTAGLILIVVFVLGRYAFPFILDHLAREKETLFVVVVGIMFILGFYAEGQHLSFGIGTFLAGLSLSRAMYRYELIGEFKPLKSFFTVLFFTSLGLQLTPTGAILPSDGIAQGLLNTMSANLWLIIVFTVLAVILKPIIVMAIVGLFGYKRSAIFNSGMTMGQLSEFSLVLIAQGVLVGLVPGDLLAPLIVVAIISMTISSYMMTYSVGLYRRIGSWFLWTERISFFKQDILSDEPKTIDGYDVAVIGCSRLGRMIQKALAKMDIHYVVVDSDPDIITQLRSENVPCIYGDVNNPEVMAQLNFGKIQTVFSSIPDNRDNILLLSHLRQYPAVNFYGIVDSRGQAAELYKLGAHYVIIPYQVAALHLFLNHGANEANLSTLLQDMANARVLGQTHRSHLFEDLPVAAK
ncbi:MAG: cation:proton antiporter [Patescibacteria group bacterium]